MNKTNLIYFSATGTTKKIVEAIAYGVKIPKMDSFSLIKSSTQAISIPTEELAIFGVPVYSGRVPSIAIEKIAAYKGSNTPAIIAVVYGNREYEDALLELRDVVTKNGFSVIAAGAFIGEHAIFPAVAQARPDAADLLMAKELGAKAMFSKHPKKELLAVPGNNPYRSIANIPLAPKTLKRKCNQCGVCTAICPVGAIGSPKPHTDKKKCIKCAHCIAKCPKNARSFDGLLYWLAGKAFIKKNSTHKEPVLFY